MDFPIFSIEPVLPDGINPFFGVTEKNKTPKWIYFE